MESLTQTSQLRGPELIYLQVRVNVPSWCDRILWKSYPETHVTCTAYGKADRNLEVYSGFISPVSVMRCCTNKVKKIIIKAQPV